MPPQTTPRLPPFRNALDDEEPLPRAHVPEPSRGAARGLKARRDGKALLEPRLGRAQARDLRALGGEPIPRRVVRGERTLVEEDGNDDASDQPREAQTPASPRRRVPRLPRLRPLRGARR